jgi:O-antigen/teichoic acid export membrane protein
VGRDGTRERDLPGDDPAEYSEFKPVAVGVAIWAVLLVLALVFHDDLVADGHGWWMWTALAGLVEGLFGYAYLMRRRARMNARTMTGNAPSVTEQDDRTPGRS